MKLRKWADLAVIAPLDANTLAKMATGLCDNLLVRKVEFCSLIIIPTLANNVDQDSFYYYRLVWCEHGTNLSHYFIALQ